MNPLRSHPSSIKICGVFAALLVAVLAPTAEASELVVTTHDVVSPAALTQGLGMQPVHVRHSGSRMVVVLPDAVDVSAARDQLAAVRGVRSVQVDQQGQGVSWGHYGWGHAWGHHHGHNHGPTYKAWHDDVLRLKKAHQRQDNAAGIVIALLDSGLTTVSADTAESPGLAGTPILAGYDFVNDTAFPDDDNGHGTMMANIIADIAPSATLLPVKVLDGDRIGSEADLAAGIDYAVISGANIISMSLAFPPGYVPSGFLTESIDRAADLGIVLIGATGNHGQGEVSYPAAYGSVVSVGSARLAQNYWGWFSWAAAYKTNWAEYSGWGTPVDVAAPGGDLEFDLNQDGFPDGVLTESFNATGEGYQAVLVSGTSAAAAQVTGVSALLLAAGASADEVRPALQKTATGIGPSGFDALTGAGVINAHRAVKRVDKNKVPNLDDRFVSFSMMLLTDGAQTRAVAYVEVVDADGDPVPNAVVRGHYRGDVVHDVEGTTDAAGAVLMASLPVAGGALFEFSVDKVFTHKSQGGGGYRVAAVPKSFTSIGLNAFRQMSAISTAPSDDPIVGGAGAGVSPFLVAFPADALLNLVTVLAQTTPRGPDFPAGVQPVRTIPSDLELLTPVDSLLARNFGRSAIAGPTGFVVSRELASVDCTIAVSPIVALEGAGAGVSPFLDPDGDTSSIFVVDDGSDAIFLDGSPTDAASIDIVVGQPGLLITADDGSTCVPIPRIVVDIEALPVGVQNGSRTVNGVTMALIATQSDPEFADFAQSWNDLVARADVDGVPSPQDTVMQGTSASAPFCTGDDAAMGSNDWVQALP